MNGMLVVVFSIFFKRIQTENITLDPGDENKYSIVTGDTLTLRCPAKNLQQNPIRWSYLNDTIENILSIGETLATADFPFSVSYTNSLKDMIYLRIYNITPQQHVYKCFFPASNEDLFEYKYNIRLENVTNSLRRHTNGSVCCLLHGRSIRSNKSKFIWQQRTLHGEYIRFIESVQNNYSGTSNRDANLTMHEYNYLSSCINLNNTNGSLKYVKEGEYICTAQFFIYGRNQMIDRTESIKIEDIKDRPFCIQDTRSQHSLLGTNITIFIQFYSKPKYTVLSFRKNDSESKLRDEPVNMTNISLDVYNVTILVSGYEIIIHITEFSEKDVGNYTVNISNGFGFCSCTVQLLFEGNNCTEKDVIEDTKRAETTKSLLWYILACGSIIVVLFAMSALRSTFSKTVDTCSKPNIRKPSCHKSTEKQATKKAAKKTRRAYSDQFMEVTLNQLNNGERILIIGQTNEMDASTETNI